MSLVAISHFKVELGMKKFLSVLISAAFIAAPMVVVSSPASAQTAATAAAPTKAEKKAAAKTKKNKKNKAKKTS